MLRLSPEAHGLLMLLEHGPIDLQSGRRGSTELIEKGLASIFQDEPRGAWGQRWRLSITRQGRRVAPQLHGAPDTWTSRWGSAMRAFALQHAATLTDDEWNASDPEAAARECSRLLRRFRAARERYHCAFSRVVDGSQRCRLKLTVA